MSVRPVHWAYDHALRLWPPPDVLLLAESYEQYSWQYEGVRVCNPGSFLSSPDFMMYAPATRNTAFCGL